MFLHQLFASVRTLTLDRIRDMCPVLLSHSQSISNYAVFFPGALTPPINYYRHYMKTASTATSSKDTSDIDALGLFIFGELDDYLVHDHLTVAQKHIKNLQVRIVQGASHFVQQDDHDTVNRYMREFLSSR